MLGAGNEDMTMSFPTISAAQSLANFAISASLTTGGAPQTISYSTLPLNASAVLFEISPILFARYCLTSSSNALMVPSIKASEGITL